MFNLEPQSLEPLTRPPDMMPCDPFIVGLELDTGCLKLCDADSEPHISI